MQKGAYAVIAAIVIVFALLEIRQKNLPRDGESRSSPALPSRDRERPSLPAATTDGITVYFSPNGGCEAAIATEIRSARKTIDMQAYSFTSLPIAYALIDAHDRGVTVRAIVDRTASNEHSSHAGELPEHGIATYTDGEHPIAHNKIIIIDGQTIITGSFNFTHQAEHENAENLLIITGKPALAGAYEINFEHHLSHSLAFSGAAMNHR